MKFKRLEVFYEIVDFFVLDMCSKPIFCSKVAQKGKICSRLLEPQKVAPNAKIKVAQKLPGTIGKGLVPFTLHVLMEVQSSLIMDLSLDIRASSCFVWGFFGHFLNSIKKLGVKLSRKFQVMFYLIESQQKGGN